MSHLIIVTKTCLVVNLTVSFNISQHLLFFSLKSPLHNIRQRIADDTLLMSLFATENEFIKASFSHASIVIYWNEIVWKLCENIYALE